ncbi:MAG: thiamine phosphate synthase [Alphaproteobacteria bacterium]|nr:thiamine phosphate synthase [Alphaproteobacteria bacterium]
MRVPRLLPISPGWPDYDLLSAGRALAEAGCEALMLREPLRDEVELIELTENLSPLFPTLILHASSPGALSLARRLGLPLHLPGRLPPQSAAALGVAGVGWSAHALTGVLAAAAAGVDYALLSPAWRPTSKPGDARAALGPRRIADAQARVDLPILGLGGVTPARARALRDAGVHGAAVLGGVFQEGASDAEIRAAASELLGALG